MSLVYINGKTAKPEEAYISVYDRGFLFGDAVYEVTRSYGKVLFALEKHIDRLYFSANRILLDIGMSKDDLFNEVYKFYNIVNEPDKYLRIQISRGNVKKEQISLLPKNFDRSNIVMYLHDLKLPSENDYKKGISIKCAEVIRNSKSAMDPNIKSGNYLNNIMAALSLNEDYSDAFFLDSNGYITEGTTYNIFYVKNNKIFTSPDNSDILHGITRSILFELAEREKLSIEKVNFKYEDLIAADEVFGTSSTKEIFPITKVDTHKIKSGLVGDTTLNLSKLYKRYVLDYCEKANKND